MKVKIPSPKSKKSAKCKRMAKQLDKAVAKDPLTKDLASQQAVIVDLCDRVRPRLKPEVAKLLDKMPQRVHPETDLSTTTQLADGQSTCQQLVPASQQDLSILREQKDYQIK